MPTPMEQKTETVIVGLGPSAAQKRRARKEARSQARVLRSAGKKYGLRLSPDARREIEAGAAELVRAAENNDHDAVAAALARADEITEKHLHFARKSTFREYTDSIGVAVIVALLLRAFVVEAFKIPSGSMIPTLAIGDHIFVNKFIYGLRIPFTTTRFFEWRKPQHGEVIVFIYPEDPSKDFIKRVIAVEGETVEVRNDIVSVNGKEIPHHEVVGEYRYWDYEESNDRWMQKKARAVEETWGNETYTTLQSLDVRGYRDFPPSSGPFVVPPGHVFVMGDNRANSQDSRFWHSPGLPMENIKGKALIVWWSWGEPEGLRWKRIGHLVE
jgi:signal peptidase I